MRVSQIFIYTLVMGVLSGVANAAAPSTTCPAGYITVTDRYVVLGDTCTNYYQVSNSSISSCLTGTSHGAKCWMYAPANTNFTDGTGTYHFTNACPLT